MSPPYDDHWGNVKVMSWDSVSPEFSHTPTCAHGSPTYLVCTVCAQEKDRKKHRVEALANALAKADGDMKQAFLEAHTKVYDLMEENKQLSEARDRALKAESQAQSDNLYYKQRAFNAESKASFQQSLITDLQQQLLVLKKQEQERIDNAIAELEMKERVIPAQSLRKLDLED